MMPQPPHHKEEQPRGLTDQTVDAAHDFMEHAEEDMERATEGKSSSLGTEEEDKSMLDKAKDTAKEAKDKLSMGIK
ncbi:hypothetical protein VUR80DRAFT_1774 [Thermomyces stellatus]